MLGTRLAATAAVIRGLLTWPAAEDGVDRRAGLPVPPVATTPAAFSAAVEAVGRPSEPSRLDTATDVVVDGGVADEVQAVMARRWTAW